MEEQKQQIEAIRDYWNQRANGFALAVDEELKLEEAKEWERQFRDRRRIFSGNFKSPGIQGDGNRLFG